MEHNGNPARVLLQLLTQAAESEAAGSNATFDVVWQTVLDRSDDDLARTLFEIGGLAGELRDALRANGMTPGGYQARLASFELGLFNAGAGTPWVAFWAAIQGPELVATLTFAADMLDHAPNVALRVVDVDGLRVALDDLRDSIAVAQDLDDDLKTILVSHLDEMIDALQGVGTVRTTRRLWHAFERFVAAIGLTSKAKRLLEKSVDGARVLAIIAVLNAAAGRPIVGTPIPLHSPDPVVFQCITGAPYVPPAELESPPRRAELNPGKAELNPGDEADDEGSQDDR